MSHRYRVHGLVVRASLPLATMESPGRDEEPVDLDIRVADDATAALDWSDATPVFAGTETFWRLAPDVWRFGYTAESGARWDFTCVRGERAEVRWMSGIPMPDIRTYLLNTGIAIALTLRGVTALHASGIVIDGHAALFLGRSGVGKSTTVASLASAGHALLTDDVAALETVGSDREGHVVVHAGPTHVRLLADSARALDQPFDTLRPVWTDPAFGAKRYLEASEMPATLAARLGVVYLLAPDAAGQPPLSIAPIERRDALEHLIRNMHAGRWADGTQRAPLFRTLARVADTVPMRRVRRGHGLADLPRLMELVAEDVRRTVSGSGR